MTYNHISASTDAISSAVAKDTNWKAYLPVTSTHFIYDGNGNIIPNKDEVPSVVNIFNMIDSSVLNDNLIQLQMDAKHYPHRKGAPRTALQLEQFHGDDAHSVSLVEKSLKDIALSHSTVLTSRKEQRSGRK